MKDDECRTSINQCPGSAHLNPTIEGLGHHVSGSLLLSKSALFHQVQSLTLQHQIKEIEQTHLKASLNIQINPCAPTS